MASPNNAGAGPTVQPGWAFTAIAILRLPLPSLPPLPLPDLVGPLHSLQSTLHPLTPVRHPPLPPSYPRPLRITSSVPSPRSPVRCHPLPSWTAPSRGQPSIPPRGAHTPPPLPLLSPPPPPYPARYLLRPHRSPKIQKLYLNSRQKFNARNHLKRCFKKATVKSDNVKMP